jgi:hypothetical protein
MIKQMVLPIKVESTKNMITSHAILTLLGEFAVGLGLNKAVKRHLPYPGSGAGYLASGNVFPLVLILNGGDRTLTDSRRIRKDAGLREILPLKRLPSADATGNWSPRSRNNAGLKRLAQVNHRILTSAVKKKKVKGYALDMDATGIEPEKEPAKMTHKGYNGSISRENGVKPGSKNRRLVLEWYVWVQNLRS